MKKCSKCGADKPLSDYSKHRGCKWGVRPDCRKCVQGRAAARYTHAAENNPRVLLLNWARGRAKRAGIPFAITEEDIVIPKRCPVLGIPLKRGSGIGGALPSSPSIDRIDPTQGYVPGNVIVVSHRANTIKGDATPAEMRAVAVFYSTQV